MPGTMIRVRDEFLGERVADLDLPWSARRRLRRAGILYEAQLHELIHSWGSAKTIARFTGLEPAAARRRFPTPPSGLALGSALGDLPSLGLAGPADSSRMAATERKATRSGRKALLRTVERRLAEVEPRVDVDLTPRDPSPVRSQGNLGSCTGMATAPARGFLCGTELSYRYAYEGAKRIDGHAGEGSWIRYCLKWMYRVGAVLESRFPYTDRKGRLAIKHLSAEASEYRIRGYTDLRLEAADMKRQPMLLEAVLRGLLNPRLGPRPVPAGFALYENFFGPTTRSTGVVAMPMGRKVGGHAMLIVGVVYLQGHRYFLVKNSWGTERWAPNSVLGPRYKGYCLFPEPYLQSSQYFWEAHLVVG